MTYHYLGYSIPILKFMFPIKIKTRHQIFSPSIVFGLGLLMSSFSTNNGTSRVIYTVEIGEGRSNEDQIIERYSVNEKDFIDVTRRTYLDFGEYENGLKQFYGLRTKMIDSIELSSNQIDTLNVFENMVLSDSVIHNMGIKIACRGALYRLETGANKTELRSRNLYNLIKALGIESQFKK